MQAQKNFGQIFPTVAIATTTIAIATTSLIINMNWSNSRYPSTSFPRPILGEKTEPNQTLLGHSTWIYTVAIAPDGKTLASGSYDGKIKIWHSPTGKLLHAIDAHPDPVSSLAISNDGEILVSGSWDDCMKVWNLRTGELIYGINTYADDVKAVAISPDSKTVATGTYSGAVKLWEIETGKEIDAFKHSGPVAAVAFSPDGKHLASGSRNGSVKIWKLNTGWELSIAAHGRSVWAIALSPDGQTLASGGQDRMVKIWQVETGEEISVLDGHANAVYSVAFSPDGKTLASGSYDRKINLWQVQTKELQQTFSDHSKAVWSVGFSPDGKSLVSGSADKTIKLWSVSAANSNTISGAKETIAQQRKSPDFVTSTGEENRNQRPETPKNFQRAAAKTTSTDGQLESVRSPTIALEIADMTKLQELNQKLYDRIDSSWQEIPTWHEDLVFQVRVNEDGAIAFLEPMNRAGSDYLSQTPLADAIAAVNPEVEDTSPQPFGIFRVVMTPRGMLEVSPWRGWVE